MGLLETYLEKEPTLGTLGFEEEELTFLLLQFDQFLKEFLSGEILEDELVLRLVQLTGIHLEHTNPDPYELQKLQLFQVLFRIVQKERNERMQEGTSKGKVYRKSNGKSLLEKEDAAYVHVLMLGLLTFFFETIFLVASYFMFR